METATIENTHEDFKVVVGSSLPDGSHHATKEQIIEAIKMVFDPEISINVYDLGLIYRMEQKDNGDVEIDMTLTSPLCPVAGDMPKMVAAMVTGVEGVGQTTVKLVWEPAWRPDMIAEEIRDNLEFF